MELIYRHKNKVVLAGIFIMAWIFSFYFSTRLLMRETQEIVVPKVIGFPLNEAERMLKLRKLDVKIDKFEETGEFPENTVLAQSVEPGTIVKENRILLLRVSKQKDRIEVPTLIDKDLFDAKNILEKKNLKLTNVAYGCNKKIKSGKIVSQNPQHEEFGQDRNVQVLVSSGPCQSQFMIGNMVDQRIDTSIKKEFSDKDVGLRQTSTQNRDNLKRAKVVAQEPVAGSIVKSGDNVVLNME